MKTGPLLTAVCERIRIESPKRETVRATAHVGVPCAQELLRCGFPGASASYS